MRIVLGQNAVVMESHDWPAEKTFERKFSLTIIWIVSMIWGTAAGFYFGTIWATESYLDMIEYDVRFGLLTALIGLAAGVLFAILVTCVYPKYVNRDIDEFADFHPKH